RQDGTAGAGAHAKTEAVDLRTTTVVGLEGSLAHGYISATVDVLRTYVNNTGWMYLGRRSRESLELAAYGRSQLIKSTGLISRGQTVHAKPHIIHTRTGLVATDPPSQTKVVTLHTRWITLCITQPTSRKT